MSQSSTVAEKTEKVVLEGEAAKALRTLQQLLSVDTIHEVPQAALDWIRRNTDLR